jgi:hypothetical protein
LRINYWKKSFAPLVANVTIITFTAIILSCTNSENENQAKKDLPQETVEQSTTPGNVPEKEQVLKISPNKIWNEVEHNIVAAKDKYEGKMLEVTGPVTKIDEGEVEMVPFDRSVFVTCYYKDEYAKIVAQLSLKQVVTVKGVIRLTIDIDLYDCEISKK